jgi:hypothetical protein
MQENQEELVDFLCLLFGGLLSECPVTCAQLHQLFEKLIFIDSEHLDSVVSISIAVTVGHRYCCWGSSESPLPDSLSSLLLSESLRRSVAVVVVVALSLSMSLVRVKTL